MSATSATPVDTTGLSTVTSLLIIGLCLYGGLTYLWVYKFSALAVLKTGDKFQSHTLALFYEGVDAIPLDECQSLYDRYSVLSDLRAEMSRPKSYAAMLPAGTHKRRWLIAAKALKDDAEVVFERSMRGAIGAKLVEQRKRAFNTPHQL